MMGGARTTTQSRERLCWRFSQREIRRPFRIFVVGAICIKSVEKFAFGGFRCFEELQIVQLAVFRIERQKLFVGALFNDVASHQHDDLIRLPHSR